MLFVSMGYLGIRHRISYLEAQQIAALRHLLPEDVHTVAVTIEIAPTKTDETATAAQAAPSPTPRIILDRYAALYRQNADLIGWITIEKTPMDYPVMQTPQEKSFYLHRDFEKRDSDGGLPFADERCCVFSDYVPNVLLYGHNMRSGAMFGSLDEYLKERYFTEHRIILFDTLYRQGAYEIFSVFRTRVLDGGEEGFRFYQYAEIPDEAVFDAYVDTVKSLSLYETDATPVWGDSLLTLATCNRYVKNGRLIVVAVRLPETP